MQNLTTVEAREHFADIINRALYAKERTVVVRHGKGVAAIVPLADLELLECLEDAADVKEALAAKAEMKKKGAVKWEDLKKDAEIE